MTECPETQITPRFERAAEHLLDDEGGYVNDPDDRGGSTIWGLTLAFLRDRVDSGFTTRRQKEIGREEAKRIYFETIWSDPHNAVSGASHADLPVGVGLVVFSTSVNAGEPKSFELLQRALRRMGYRTAVDGWLGPETIETAERAFASRPLRLIEGIGTELILHYNSLIRSGYGAKFERGWMRRAAGLIAEAGNLIQRQPRP
jgi:lysozyme family protein